MSSNDKWMPLYVADYLGDTMHLTTLQHGAYVLLLMHYWRTGPLPDDHGELAAIVKLDDKTWASVWAKLSGFFTVNGDGTLHQKRMDWERKRWESISDKRRDAGRRGAEAKHRSHPSGGGGPITPQAKPQTPPRVERPVIAPHHEPEPTVAIARILPERLPPTLLVDNLANATNLPPTLPPTLPPVSGNCQDFATTFASVPLPPQRKNLTSYLGKEAARERARGENRGKPKEDFPVEASKPREPWTRDALKEILDELPPPPQPFEHPKRGHTLDVQIRAVKPDRPKACHLSGPSLAHIRKQAGILVAVP